MKIRCLTTFLDGKERFEQDDVRTVSDERGAYFVANGWAESMDGSSAAEAPPANVELTINNAALGTGDSNG
jgi:hypothetical protein